LSESGDESFGRSEITTVRGINHDIGVGGLFSEEIGVL
jgi:hypothetical protein